MAKTTAVAKKNPNTRRKKRAFTIPMAIVAGIAPTGIKVWEARGGGMSGMAREAGRILTGFDFWTGQWIPGAMRYGLWPMVGGYAVHWLLGQKLGMNRAIARTGLPIIRI